MKLYISTELSKLKEQLGTRGFEIVDSSQDCYDAAICNLKDINFSELNFNKDKFDCILIIDSGSKNIDDIENILMNKN